MTRMSNYAPARMICVDLRPFDPIAEDFGVQAYLDLLGFTPDSIVFLNFFVDFLHDRGDIDDRPLNRLTVGQRGTPAKASWSRVQLLGLVTAIRARGIAAHLGILSSTRSDVWANVNSDFTFDEVIQTTRGGAELFGGSINPLKRLADGTFYEDVFVRDLVRVLNDYSFDGYVAGDGMLGLRGPRDTLKDSDFSVDMVSQFSERSGIVLPELADYDARADQVVANHFEAWVAFYVQRWADHVAKVAAALHPIGCQFIAIDSWSRNPEDLVASFGIDYRLLHENGLDAVLVQARETNKWRKHREGEYVREENSVFTFLAHKAYAPDLTFYWAQATANLPEFWNSVIDLPNVLERETYAYLWTVAFRDGAFQPCVDGICVIWGNDLSRENWRFLSERWDRAAEQLSSFAEPLGLTLVWTEKGIAETVAGRAGNAGAFADLLNSGILIQSAVATVDLGALADSQPQRSFLAFDREVLDDHPEIADRIVIVDGDRVLVDGDWAGGQDAVARLAARTRVTVSTGRVLGFRRFPDDGLVLSVENPANLFYEHVTVELPLTVGDVEVLPPRDWYRLPGANSTTSTVISVPPDGSTQLVVTSA
jgi:hypothetical protein